MIKVIPQPKVVELIENTRFMAQMDDARLCMERVDERITGLLEKTMKGADIRLIEASVKRGYYLTINSEGHTLDEEALKQLGDRDEGYILTIDTKSISIYSGHASGLFYGIQTLRQILANHKSIPCVKIIDWPDIKMRCMYLDLRVTYPKFENILAYIEEYAEYKANTLIVEYEDKFPFEKYKMLRHRDQVFTEEQVRLIKLAAHDNFIEIIPLQQCFGHLEYVLKHDKYKGLREVNEEISSICPSNPESLRLVTDLLEEMIDAHPEARYVHIGCDEVVSLCTCSACMKAFGGSRTAAFLHHVNKLVDFASKKGKVPVIWHDMMTHFTEEDFAGLDKRAVVMIWLYYGSQIESEVSRVAEKLRNKGIKVMGAPSVCCSDGRHGQNYPIADKRVENIVQWAESACRYGMECVVATNWAVPGSMGMPYGIFETSLYLVHFSAEKLWNAGSDDSSFLVRYLAVYHCVDKEEVLQEFTGCKPEAYYDSIDSLLPRVGRNSDIAEYLGIVREYQHAMHTFEYLNKLAYRCFGPDAEIEKMTLLTRYKVLYKELSDIRRKMERKLDCFLPKSIVEHYISSRFFLVDFMHREFYLKLQ